MSTYGVTNPQRVTFQIWNQYIHIYSDDLGSTDIDIVGK